MIDKLFIDECLSMALVSVAKSRGVSADYGPHIGKAGWQDWNIVPFALANDYVIVTNNRRHFLKEYAKQSLHGGLIIIIPSVDRDEQVRLFTIALDLILGSDGDLVNKVIEILEDGSVHMREWTSEEHDANHIANPPWR